MRIIFMGTPEFAVSSLDSLIKNKFNVVAVVTAPDKPAGRGQQLHESAVKKYARENSISLLQPEKLKNEVFLEQLRSLKADLQIVVAFRMLPEAVWQMPRLGTYNLHASLLPRYRGAAPINWAIINGDKETGVTTFKLQHEIDTGNILFTTKVEIGDTTTAGELHDTLMHVGADLIVKTVTEIKKCDETGIELNFQQQKDLDACHAPKIFKETCRILWDKPVKQIYDLIRGLSPYPTAYTTIRNGSNEPLSLKIFAATYEIKEHSEANGTLLTDNKNYLRVYCNGGVIELKDLQLQGKKRMMASEFLRGFKLNDRAIFTS